MKKLLLSIIFLPFLAMAQRSEKLVLGSPYVLTPSAFQNINFVAASAAADFGTTTAAPAYPTGNLPGDYLLYMSWNRFGESTPSGLTFFTGPATASGGVGTNGDDAGTVRTSVFERLLAATVSSTKMVTVPGANVTAARIFCYRNDTGLWGVASSTGTDNTAGTDISMAFANPGLQPGDVVVVTVAFNTDAYDYSGDALTAAGITFEAPVLRASHLTNAISSDMEMRVLEFRVTAGTSTTGNVTYTATSDGTTTNRPAGSGVLTRLRQQ